MLSLRAEHPETETYQVRFPDYVTITYGLHRTGSGDQSLLDHLFFLLGKKKTLKPQ